ncbi:Scr1 family TA system antitoxin-like transcriptional regulator [Actinocorallia aurea]
MAAGLSGVRLAAAAGVPQATVSRVETGRRVADAAVVVRILVALGGEALGLVEVVRGVYEESVVPRVDAGVSYRSGAVGEVLGRVGVVRAMGVGVVPSVVRTEGYGVAGGLGRSVVEVVGKRVEVVLGEGVLRTWPGSGEEMVAQLDRLVELDAGGEVVVGVLPFGAAGGVVPLHGFTVFGEEAVVVETFTRELTLTGEGEVREYLRVFEEVRGLAVFGVEARRVVEAARADLVKVLRSIH